MEKSWCLMGIAIVLVLGEMVVGLSVSEGDAAATLGKQGEGEDVESIQRKLHSLAQKRRGVAGDKLKELKNGTQMSLLSSSGPSAYHASCIQYTNCLSCLQAKPGNPSGCGWCLTMGLCLDTKTPYTSPTQCRNNLTKTAELCEASAPTPVGHCSGVTGPLGCFFCLAIQTDGRCGFCASDNTCMAGSASGPSVRGACNAGWQYGYEPGHCAACSLMSTCGACSSMTGCAWCPGGGFDGAGICRRANSEGVPYNTTGCPNRAACALPTSSLSVTASVCEQHLSCGGCLATAAPTGGNCTWCVSSRSCYDAASPTGQCIYGLSSRDTCDLCSQYDTQAQCLNPRRGGHCGWNVLLQQCQLGDSYGPLPPAIAPPFYTAWQANTFPAGSQNCSSLTSCSSCTGGNLYCGWCPTEQICTTGTNFGPGDRSVCTNTWHFNIAQCAIESRVCSLNTRCMTCVADGGQAQCGWCAHSKRCIDFAGGFDCVGPVRVGDNATLQCASLPGK